MCGVASLRAGRLAEAADIFGTMTTIYTSRRLFWGVWDNNLPYYLARTYEESRWYDRAIVEYERFLAAMAEADFLTDEVRDARQRLAALKSRT